MTDSFLTHSRPYNCGGLRLERIPQIDSHCLSHRVHEWYIYLHVYTIDLSQEWVNTVDGSEILHQLIWSIFHDLQGFIHFRWCRISCINSISYIDPMFFF